MKEIPETLLAYWAGEGNTPAYYEYLFSKENISPHDPKQIYVLHVYWDTETYYAVMLKTWDGWKDWSQTRRSEFSGRTCGQALYRLLSYEIPEVSIYMEEIVLGLLEMVKWEEPEPKKEYVLEKASVLPYFKNTATQEGTVQGTKPLDAEPFIMAAFREIHECESTYWHSGKAINEGDTVTIYGCKFTVGADRKLLPYKGESV